MGVGNRKLKKLSRDRKKMVSDGKSVYGAYILTA